MVTKPGKIYRIPKVRSYTRKEYMKGLPQSKISIFDMGELVDIDKFPLEMSLVAKNSVQITHNALEAARIAANRQLQENTGKTGYYLKFRIYPHEALRENKQAVGAGADRVSDGMRRAFGKTVGLGGKVKKGQKIMSVRTDPKHYLSAKTALRKAAAKLPTSCRISIDKGAALVKV
ncbi:MAG: 50S ribosomal protein L16 [Candidatus Hydrothermarchaeaceae archaeon]